ncbi:protein kinase [Penicillium cataractarum]|uniref:Protein kinase n=1 Tax=Penicillium cataractarum TaxID=2100454 RepID=A0A9W9UVW7_9EURO|nr:protein kinase [Penicillium cataractarum]KAJ5359468.1 protein kinase [Penicillium cataractarum]
MATTQQKFPDVHWVWQGGISFVYEVHPSIVVKVPKPGEFEREQFQNELKVYEILSRHTPCPSIVQCFLYTDNGIFLEYMQDASLCSRIQKNHILDRQTLRVTKVEKLEPLTLRKEWMNDLAQAVAFLESLNLAHGDLRPENILINGDQLKLSDFDCTAEIGTDFEACIPPYGRMLNSDEETQREWGSGLLGPRTEQFALGSIFYFINYGFAVYGDTRLTEDPNKHGCKVVELLQNMQFPNLNGDPLLDDIINKCWHNKYVTIAELATYTAKLLPESDPPRNTDTKATSPPNCLTNEAANPEITNPGDPGNGDIDQNCSPEVLSKISLCESLVGRGLLDILSSREPEQLGFTLEWYRYHTG